VALRELRAEIPRTILHVGGGALLAILGYGLPVPSNRVVLGIIFLAAVAVEAGRKTSPVVDGLTATWLGVFMRPSERFRVTGALPFTGGIFLTFLLFQKEVALLAVIPLVVGDRAAILVGKWIGRVRFGKKSLEGSLACFIVSFLTIFCVAGFAPGAFPYPAWILLGASVVGTVAEALPSPFDDNLTIPLAVAVFIYWVGA